MGKKPNLFVAFNQSKIIVQGRGRQQNFDKCHALFLFLAAFSVGSLHCNVHQLLTYLLTYLLTEDRILKSL